MVTKKLPVVAKGRLWAWACMHPAVQRDVEIRKEWPKAFEDEQWGYVMSTAQCPLARDKEYINERLERQARQQGGEALQVDLATKLALPQHILGMALYGKPDPTAPASVWHQVSPEMARKYGTECWRIIKIFRFSRPVALGHKMNQGVPKQLSSWSKQDTRVSERALRTIRRELERGVVHWIRR